MYIVGNANDTVHQYALSTPWEVQTAVYEPGKIKSVAAQDNNPLGIFFKPDGTKMYMVGTTDTVYQYDLTTLVPDLTTSITWPSTVTWSTGIAPIITGDTLIEMYKYNGIWHATVVTNNL